MAWLIGKGERRNNFYSFHRSIASFPLNKHTKMRVLHPRIILSVKTSCRGGCHARDLLPAAALQLTRTTTRRDTAPLTQSTRAVLVMGGKSLHYNFFSQFQVADLSVLRPVPSLPSFMLKDANSRILCRGQKEDVVKGDPQTNIKWRQGNLY